MSVTLPSRQELYDIFKAEMQSLVPELTDWEEGSINDILAGLISVAGEQMLTVMTQKFNKTFFDTAHGPEVTGGPDDLELLAVDHFGDGFARPAAVKATGDVTFSRPTTGAGNVTILAGTIIKTDKDASGNEQRFETVADGTMTGLSLSLGVRAIEGGTSGNVGGSTVINIESALTDPTVVVTNPLAFTGGEDEEDDATYRETIRDKITAIRGATKAAIEASARVVPGVVTVTAIESLMAVKEWNIGGSVTVGDYFRIPSAQLYIADAAGGASTTLIDDVEAAIESVRACGVRVEVIGATPLSINWEASISLNPAGPNYTEFASDPQQIIDSMTQYIKGLAIGEGFNRYLAGQAMLAIWGPTGTNDLTNFITLVPSGDVTATASQKLVPGTVDIP